MLDDLQDHPTVIYIVARSGAEVNGVVCQNPVGYPGGIRLTQSSNGVIIGVGRPTADSGRWRPPAL